MKRARAYYTTILDRHREMLVKRQRVAFTVRFLEQIVGGDGHQPREALGDEREERQARIAAQRLEHDHLAAEAGLLVALTGQHRERHQRQAPAAPAQTAEQPVGCVLHRLGRRVRQHFGNRRVGQQQLGRADADQDAADVVEGGIHSDRPPGPGSD